MAAKRQPYSYSSEAEAIQKAESIIAALGANWTPHVWENIGWFAEAKNRTCRVSYNRNDDSYTAEILPGYISGDHVKYAVQFWGRGTTPTRALSDAIAKVVKLQRAIAKSLLEARS